MTLMYVLFSFVTSRYSSTFAQISKSRASPCSTSAPVAQPVLVRPPDGMPSFSNRIVPSCCGEPMLNCWPAII